MSCNMDSRHWRRENRVKVRSDLLPAWASTANSKKSNAVGCSLFLQSPVSQLIHTHFLQNLMHISSAVRVKLLQST